MEINIKKCGTFTNSLHVDNEPIPVVENYKYLGVFINKQGIDINKSIENLKNRALATFINLKQHFGSNLWTPMTRIGIYKTFIRPKMEYGAPIMNRLMKNVNFNKLENLQKDILSWIIGQRQPSNLIRNITNILTVKDRYDQLQAMYLLHIKNIPLTHLLNESIENPKGLLKSTLQCRYSNELSKPAIKDHYKNKNLNMDLTMVKVISDSNRTKAGVDKILAIKHRATRKNAIKWRLNALPRDLICNGCNQPFNRKHVNSCINNILPKKLRNEFKLSKRITNVESFNPLDYYLNTGKIKLFKNGIKEITKQTTVNQTNN
jgi:hypothetical protein